MEKIFLKGIKGLMKNDRNLLIIGEKKLQNKISKCLKKLAQMYCVVNIQQGMYHISRISMQLIILQYMDNIEMTCMLIKSIRAIKKTPILMTVPTEIGIKEKEELIVAGADNVILENSVDKDIELQSFSLMRRYAEWSENSIKSNTELMQGKLCLNYTYRKMYWSRS